MVKQLITQTLPMNNTNFTDGLQKRTLTILTYNITKLNRLKPKLDYSPVCALANKVIGRIMKCC